MKVLYDHQAFTGMTYGGVTRYFYELMQVYADRDDIDFELSLRFSNNEYLDKASFSNHHRYGFSQWRNVSRIASAELAFSLENNPIRKLLDSLLGPVN